MRKEVLLALTAMSAAACGLAGGDGETTATDVSALEGQGSVKKGERFFHNEFPGVQGNGRACATCHVPADGFQLTPAHAEARWAALQAARAIDPSADDPLFRSIDDNDGQFTFLRKWGLVKIVLKLPTDANGNKLVFPLDDPGATEVAVWRASPTIRNVAITAPYQQDGRFATLEQQALGALRDHAEIKHEPDPVFLTDVGNWQKTQFSSPGVAAVAAALAAGQTPADPDPALTGFEAEGKALFIKNCTVCHGGPAQTVPIPPFQFTQDIMVSRPVAPFVPVDPDTGKPIGFPDAPPLPVRLWFVQTGDPANPLIRPSTDPGKVLISGRPEDFNQFDVPTVFGISKTAPYFHDNSAKTLEEVMLHYQALFNALRLVIPPDVPFPFRPDALSDDDNAKIVAYMKKI